MSACTVSESGNRGIIAIWLLPYIALYRVFHIPSACASSCTGKPPHEREILRKTGAVTGSRVEKRNKQGANRIVTSEYLVECI
jgi:hypothetical protein